MYSFDKVQPILDEADRSGVVQVPGVSAGSLVFFNGRHSLHRVSPVVGSTPRINAILTYETQAGQKLNAYGAKTFFGRTVVDE